MKIHTDKEFELLVKVNEKLLSQNKQLSSDLKKYKKGYAELECYFDSISDEEQPKVAKRLEKIFKQ
jgi:predicted RNase H-like nuclease (RuvC/YqgF family)